jgi:hypothetical protein
MYYYYKQTFTRGGPEGFLLHRLTTPDGPVCVGLASGILHRIRIIAGPSRPRVPTAMDVEAAASGKPALVPVAVPDDRPSLLLLSVN